MATAKAAGVALLREQDSPYERLTNGYEVARVVYDADVNTLGGGWGRMLSPTGRKDDDQKYGITDYAARYDLVLFVVSGALEVTSAKETTVAGSGEGILIAKGTLITLLGRPGTVFFYLLHPIDWAESFARSSIGPIADVYMRDAIASGMSKQRLAADLASILATEQRLGRDAIARALESAVALKRYTFDDVRSILDETHKADPKQSP